MIEFKVGDEVFINTPNPYHAVSTLTGIAEGRRGVTAHFGGPNSGCVDGDGDVWVEFTDDGHPICTWIDPKCLSLVNPPQENNPIEPDHYQRNGVNFIEFIEHMPGNRFNAMKYIYRAGEKNPETLLEDLKKGQWSLNREIERLERDAANSRD